MVLKVLFAPFGLIGGVLSGALAKRAFDRTWKLIDSGAAPEPDQRGASWAKLAVALMLQGAIFRLVRGAFDRGSRETFTRLTGRWPGRQAGPQGPDSAG
jgi:hypothetical protein